MKSDFKQLNSARALSAHRALPARMDLAGLDINNDEGLSQALVSLPPLTPPSQLTTSLRVIASRERQRLVGRQSLGQVLAGWYDRACLGVTNVMRPLALPFAGGLFSSVALFSMWVVPTYSLHANSALDVPTILSTLPTVKGTAPMGVSGADLVVEVTVDDQGRMVDYTVVSGAGALKDAALRRRLENFLVFSEFVPATSFGHPRAGKMRIPVFTSSIVVKG